MCRYQIVRDYRKPKYFRLYDRLRCLSLPGIYSSMNAARFEIARLAVEERKAKKELASATLDSAATAPLA